MTDTLENILKDTNKYSLFGSAEEGEIEEPFSEITRYIPKLLIELRDFYIGLYKISGLTEQETLSSLLKKFTKYAPEEGYGTYTFSA
jgi:hypothetical protein